MNTGEARETDETREAAGGSETDGAVLLKNLCETGFDGNTGEAALALGRTTEEIERILSGDEEADEDLVMKLRGLAQERNFDIE